MAAKEIFLGIDIGTGGVRCLAADGQGEVLARAAQPLSAAGQSRTGTAHEQSPDAWWDALCAACGAVMEQLRARGIGDGDIRAVSLDGTSGTLVCLDAQGRPLRPAMMYNDGRAVDEADHLNAAAGPFCAKLGYTFAASFALAKILWIKAHEPRVFQETARFLHQSDYLAGRLCGRFNTSDYSNALKTGYDLVENRWPAWLEAEGGVLQRLPKVVAPGVGTGQVTAEAARQCGLPPGLEVVAGATDGTAGFVASGVRRVGDYNTTLGTTLVFKGLSQRLCRHPQGLIYSHKLPGDGGDLWLPGAASNTGGEWIAHLFAGADLEALDAAAATRLPVRHIAYPLLARGERFPFLRSQARGFCLPEAEGPALYAAYLQGTALVERLGYEILDSVTGCCDGEVYSTGGGSQSDVWMQCRADATGRVIHRPACPEAAFGAAILAASSTFGGPLPAMGRMIRIEKTYGPDRARAAAYNEAYHRFLEELKQREYR